MADNEIVLTTLPENKFPALEHRTFIGDPCHILNGSIWQRFCSIFPNTLQTIQITAGDAACYISVAPCMDYIAGDYALITKCNGYEIDTNKYGGLSTDSGLLGVLSINMPFAQEYTSTMFGRDYTKAVLDFQKKLLVEKGTIIESSIKASGVIRIRTENTISAAVKNPSPKECLQQTLF